MCSGTSCEFSVDAPACAGRGIGKRVTRGTWAPTPEIPMPRKNTRGVLVNTLLQLLLTYMSLAYLDLCSWTPVGDFHSPAGGLLSPYRLFCPHPKQIPSYTTGHYIWLGVDCNRQCSQRLLAKFDALLDQQPVQNVHCCGWRAVRLLLTHHTLLLLRHQGWRNKSPCNLTMSVDR